MTRPIFAITLAGLISAASIAAQTTKPHSVWTIPNVPPQWRTVVSRADVVIVAMQDSLLRQLHDKLVQGGPALAFGACHIDTAELTRRIGRGEGIAAGMTSDRLRDPTNTPRDWAADLVAAHTGKQVREVKGFAVDLGDRIGVLRPMAQTKSCLSCHGPVAELPPTVKQLIAERYPHDRAIGFTEGEIRGWFWIEMPKPAR